MLKHYKFFTAENTYRYIHILPNFVKRYNHMKHSSIQYEPLEVNDFDMRFTVRKVLKHRLRFRKFRQPILSGLVLSLEM